MKAQKEHITYLKLPEYMIPLVVKRFGSPVRFPEGSVCHKILCRSITNNEDIESKYSRVSCSERAYNISTAKLKKQIDINDYPGTPSPSDIGKYIPIVLPLTTLRPTDMGICVSVPVTGEYILSTTGAQKLRESLRKMFWTDLTEYCNTYAESDLRDGECSTHKNHIIAFLRNSRISLDHLETVNRTDTRLQCERK